MAKMNMHIYAIFILSFGFILHVTGCSTPRAQYLDPEYQNYRSRDAVSILIIDRERFSDVSTEHVFSFLNETEARVFHGNAGAILSQVTGSDILGLLPDVDRLETPFESKVLETDYISVQVITPKEGYVVKHGMMTPRFVLIFDQYYFREITNISHGSAYAGHEQSVTSRGLYFQTNYAIWDNYRRNLVGWGSISADKVTRESPTIFDYANVLQDAFQKIVSKSPFAANR